MRAAFEQLKYAEALLIANSKADNDAILAVPRLRPEPSVSLSKRACSRDVLIWNKKCESR